MAKYVRKRPPSRKQKAQGRAATPAAQSGAVQVLADAYHKLKAKRRIAGRIDPLGLMPV